MLAGVAPITASRAINTPNQVSPDVLRKVQEAVQRTGYVPNRMAGVVGIVAQPLDRSGGAQHGGVGVHGNHRVAQWHFV